MKAVGLHRVGDFQVQMDAFAARRRARPQRDEFLGIAGQIAGLMRLRPRPRAAAARPQCPSPIASRRSMPPSRYFGECLRRQRRQDKV